MRKFIFILLVCHYSLAQAPHEWFGEDISSFPKLNIPVTKSSKNNLQLKKHIKEIKELLFQNNSASAKMHCLKFLQNYPTSPLRIPITAILKKITGKNLQLYNTFGISLRPGFKPKVMMSGLNIKNVELKLWKIDFISRIQSGIDPHFPVVDKKAVLIAKWKKTFVQKWFSTSLDAPVSKEGAYILEADDGEITATTLFFITNLALVVKRSGPFMLAWATDFRGTFPGVCQVYVISGNNIFYQGKTNERGVWGANLNQSMARVTLLVANGHSFAIADSKWFSYQEAKKRCYLTVDRPFYRPGDQVHLMGIAASKTRQGYQVARGEKLYVYIHDEKWRKIVDTSVVADKWGTFEITCSLPKNHIGKYTARVSGNFYSSIDFFASKAPYTFQVKAKPSMIPEGVLSKKDNKLIAQFAFGHSRPVFITWESEKLIGYSTFLAKDWHWQKKISPLFSPQTQVAINFIENGKYRKKLSKIDILPQEKLLNIRLENIKEKKWRIRVTDAQKQPVVATCFINIGEASRFTQNFLISFFYGQLLESVTTFYPYQFELFQDREHAFLPEELKKTKMFAKEKHKMITFKKFPKQWRLRVTTNRQGQAVFTIADDKALKRDINIIAIDHLLRIGQLRSK